MPGTSGLLSPFSDMKNFYFDDSDEPDEFKVDFLKACEKIIKEEGISSIRMNFQTKEDFYETMHKLTKFTDNHLSIKSTSVEDDMVLIIEEDENLEETSNVIVTNGGNQ